VGALDGDLVDSVSTAQAFVVFANLAQASDGASSRGGGVKKRAYPACKVVVDVGR
jgi:hypothetical protein